ncbi:MAG: hypothetical protein M3Y36_00535 [Actinomycetota bacterium]|nr:hypothetical protein [Actinomycetota bacterium]
MRRRGARDEGGARIVVFLAFIILPVIVSSVSPLVDNGAQVKGYAAQYSAQLATAARFDPATQVALTANPNSAGAQVKALIEISGRSPTDVAQVVTVSTRFADQVATLGAVDPATQAGLSSASPSAQAAAALQIAQKFNIGIPAATHRLIAVGQVPPATLAVLAGSGAAVQQAATSLKALGAVPPSVSSYLKPTPPL